MVRIAIANVTGYAGAELARLLYSHPEAEIVQVTGRSSAGQPLGKVFPHLAAVDLTISPEITESIDVAFLALHAGDSAAEAARLLKQGVKVIDISADFRLKEQSSYEEWYAVKHPAPELLPTAVYGLPELYKEQLRKANLVANPGCYPTATILGLAPALQHDLIGADIIVDAKSGQSGAGRTLKLGNHFGELDENFTAYGVNGHRHMPEIKQELEAICTRVKNEKNIRLTFIPHLVPMVRGILATSYSDLRATGKTCSQEELSTLYRDFYRDLGAPFVRVVAEPPQTKQVAASNFCLIYPTIDQRTGRLIVISVIDNLVKGAAGQAIQNMNLLCGLPETMGLTALPVYP